MGIEIMNRGKYTGIILGGLYGLLYRVLCEKNDDIIYELSIFSISFIWVLPIVIALIPIWFSREQIKSSRLKQFFFPIASVLLFFIIAIEYPINYPFSSVFDITSFMANLNSRRRLSRHR